MTDSNVQGNGFPAPFAVGMLTARRSPFTSVCARGPDAGFAAFTRRFLAQVADPASPKVSFLRRRGIGGSNPTSSSRGSANHRFRCGRRRPLGRSLGSVRNSAISSSCLSLLFVALPLARNPSRTTFVVPATQRRPIGLAGAGIWRMSDQKVYAHHRQWISRNRDAVVGLCLRRTSSTAAAATATERSKGNSGSGGPRRRRRRCSPRCDAGIKRVPRGTHWRRIDERPNPQAPRYFVLGILAIDLHCLDLLRLNISLGIQIKIHLSSFARAL
jgi:hypothetical protein